MITTKQAIKKLEDERKSLMSEGQARFAKVRRLEQKLVLLRDYPKYKKFEGKVFRYRNGAGSSCFYDGEKWWLYIRVLKVTEACYANIQQIQIYPDDKISIEFKIERLPFIRGFRKTTKENWDKELARFDRIIEKLEIPDK